MTVGKFQENLLFPHHQLEGAAKKERLIDSLMRQKQRLTQLSLEALCRCRRTNFGF